MSHSHKKLLPIGSNMNDAAYPFRGEFRLDNVINHGHSGVPGKRVPTSLSLKVSGSNLVIEQLQAPKGCQMNCELAVDGGMARPVTLGSGEASTALAVPGDGRDYHVTAIVKTDQGKHFCKMTFNGSEGQHVMRLRAPTEGHSDAVQLFVDGKRVKPVGGWFNIPLRATECALVLSNVPDATSTRVWEVPPLAQRSLLPQLGEPSRNSSAVHQTPTVGVNAVAPPSSTASPPQSFLVETVPGYTSSAVLQCMGTGQRYSLQEQTATAVPANAGPYRLHLPVPPPPPSASLDMAQKGETAAPHHPSGIPTTPGNPAASTASSPAAPHLAGAPTPAAGTTAVPVVAPRPTLELESRPHSGPNGTYCYTVIATPSATSGGTPVPPQYSVQLTAENGTVTSGIGHATITLPHKREQQVQVVVTEVPNANGPTTHAASTPVLRQRQYVPSLQAPAVGLSIQEEPGTGALVIRGVDGSRVSVGPLNGSAPVSADSTSVGRVDRAKGPHSVTVEQTNSDGSVTSARVNIDGKSSVAAPAAPSVPTSIPGQPLAIPTPTPTTTTAPVPTMPTPPSITPTGVPAVAPTPNDDGIARWANSLAQALQSPSLEEARRALASLQVPPVSPAAGTVTNFVREQMNRQTPVFAFSTQPGGLGGVSCDGLSLTATVGGQQEAPVQPGGTVSIPEGGYATLTASYPGTGRMAASLRVINRAGATPPPGPPPIATTLASPSPFGASVSSPSPEEAMLARLVECLQRHNLEPTKVADELNAIPASALSPGGLRLVPLLVNCLRRATAPTGSQSGTSVTGAAPNADGSSSADEIYFTCGNGFLDNIYTAQPHYQITAVIDGKTAIPVAQRSRLPPGGPTATFPTLGQPHFVELTAKDPLSGKVKKQVRLTVMGHEDVAPVRYSSSAPVPATAPVAAAGSDAARTPHPPTSTATPPSFTGASGTAGSAGGTRSPSGNYEPATPHAAPVMSSIPAPTASAGSPIVAPPAGGRVPYLDITLQQLGQDLQLRGTTRAGHRIVCDVDGVGGDTGLADFTTRVNGSRPHKVELTVVDPHGQVAFQQRLDVPAMSSTVWGVALQDGGLSVDPDGSCVATVAMDRGPERSIQGNFISMDSNTPHFVILRRYVNGLHGVKAGELSLRVPAFISPADIEAIERLYRTHARGALDDGGLRQELLLLRGRCATPALRELIDTLVECLQRTKPSQHVESTGAVTLAEPRGRVYFRLTGSD